VYVNGRTRRSARSVFRPAKPPRNRHHAGRAKRTQGQAPCAWVEEIGESSYLEAVIAAYLVLLSLTLVWGFTFPLVQGALASASPMVFVAIRFVLATALFSLLVWPRAFRLNRDLVWKGWWLGVFLWGGYAFQTFGLSLTTAARSGFLTGTLVPMTPLFSWLLFRHRIGIKSWLAVGLAFLGTAIMARPEAGGFNLGDVLTLICAVSFALQVVFVSRWANHENEVQLTGVQIAVTGILSALAIPFEHPHLTWTPTLGWALGVTALLATTFGIWGQLRFQPKISATAAAIIYAFEPVFAGVAAWLILGNAPGPATLLGAAFIFAGMLLTAFGPADIKPEIP
jgi:drug/metabolite transporter (DMT)-like permease